MGRLIQWNVLTLDGYFEGSKSWELSWHESVLNDEFHAFALDQLSTAEALLFGRVTYEGMAAYWRKATGDIPEFMNKLPKYVFSQTMQRADWTNSRVVAGDPIAALRKIKGQAERDLFVFGSGRLSAALFEAGLFDEVRLALAPVVIGSGTTLFGRGLSRTKMKLLEARPLSNGCVILRYEPR
jgi:dihydrofolate reductase